MAEERFDVDAPCSGSGTIRRNPDIRLLLQPAQIPEQQSLQLALLFNLWRGLKQVPCCIPLALYLTKKTI